MYVVEQLRIDEEAHEATVVCSGHRLRITLRDAQVFGLEAGMELSDEDFSELLAAEARLSCIQKSFVFLSYGDLSKRRLTEKLQRTFPKELCLETVELLEERGYLNDLQLASRYAENYYELRSYGPMRIKQELYGKGFTLSDIEQVLDPYTQADHSEKIRDLLEEKFSEESLSDPAIRRKAASWLNRFGYDWSSVSAVLNEYF